MIGESYWPGKHRALIVRPDEGGFGLPASLEAYEDVDVRFIRYGSAAAWRGLPESETKGRLIFGLTAARSI
jgi:hypothetical protein